MKKCSKCKKEKSFSEFSKRKSSKDGLHLNCKSCNKQYYEANKEKIKQYQEENKERIAEYKKQYNESNKEKIAEYFKQYQEANKERLVEYGKQYREENKERIKQYREENKERLAEWSKQYYEENKERKAEWGKQYQKQRRSIDHVFKFRINVRTLIKNSFKRGTNQFRKDAKTEQILGCTIEEFRLYIQSKFKEGMSWDNYGLNGWHLDHIIPISFAKTEEDIIRLNHYTNFQPLWAEDNLKKSNKI